MCKEYKRAITHKVFKTFYLTKRWCVVDKKIYTPKLYYRSYEKSKYFHYLSDKFLVYITHDKDNTIFILYTIGVFILFNVFLFIKSIGERSSTEDYVAFLLPFPFFFFFLAYYYTKPKKEFILDRMNGLVTFPGFMWGKNITMPVEEVVFSRSTPNVDGTAADFLEIKRPNFITTTFTCSMSQGSSLYYDDLSFLLWYMDKNRPLPKGKIFDEFRQADYERRKSEGFPEPLFEANFEIKEYTEEQQAEREFIGGW